MHFGKMQWTGRNAWWRGELLEQCPWVEELSWDPVHMGRVGFREDHGQFACGQADRKGGDVGADWWVGRSGERLLPLLWEVKYNVMRWQWSWGRGVGGGKMWKGNPGGLDCSRKRRRAVCDHECKLRPGRVCVYLCMCVHSHILLHDCRCWVVV